MIQVSPSILNAYLDLGNDDCPWMTPEKFRAQLLQEDAFSEAADAGNAAHDAAFDHALIDFPSGTYIERVTSGGKWWVDPALVLAIRAEVPGWGSGYPEVPRLVDGDELGIPGVRLSMRADYLERDICTELKTTSRIKAQKYIDSGQRWAYLVAYRVPVRFVLTQVSILRPRKRPEDVKGAVVLQRVETHHVPRSDEDHSKLKEIIERCVEYVSRDQKMLAHLEQKPAPQLL